MEFVGPDRRIIRSFYSQYVGVLLILLTFLIGAMQQPSKTGRPITASETNDTTTPIIGTFSVAAPFNHDGQLELANDKLKAVAEVLRSHDLTATLTYFTSTLSSGYEASELAMAEVRVEKIRRFLEENGVPAIGFKLEVSPLSAPEPERIQVEFAPTAGGV